MERIFITAIKCARNSVLCIPVHSQFRKIGTFCYTTTRSSVLPNLKIEQTLNFGPVNYITCRLFHTTEPDFRFDERERDMKRAVKATKDEGTEGEKALAVDNVIRGFGKLFPDEDTPNKIFEGVRFSDLPVVYIKITKNNTILTVSDAKGKTQFTRSCGMEGFKNARKGTNVAAQATAQSVGLLSLRWLSSQSPKEPTSTSKSQSSTTAAKSPTQAPRTSSYVSAATPKPSAEPVGPGAQKTGDYKNPEYYCYNQLSFYDLEIEMTKDRLPQPKSGNEMF